MGCSKKNPDMSLDFTQCPFTDLYKKSLEQQEKEKKALKEKANHVILPPHEG